MGKVKTYDPKKLFISLGSHVVTGYAEGSFISIEPGDDGTTKKVGCDGEVVRSISPDRTTKVKLTLLLSSPTVAWCQQQYIKDIETREGTFPVLIRDLIGGLVYSAEDAWIVKPPVREFDRQAPNREIEIDTADAIWEGERWN